MSSLFPDITKRKSRRIMMHVDDAGDGPTGKVIEFGCRKCGYSTGWIEDTSTVSQNKKGLPCPKCNTKKEQQ